LYENNKRHLLRWLTITETENISMELNFLQNPTLRPALLPEIRMQSCSRKVPVITAPAASGWDSAAVERKGLNDD
jgi:hypothetical protein